METVPTSPVADAMDRQMVDVTVRNNQLDADALPDKISAYYSLVFPNYTFYLQTLTVTIGRRSVRPGMASTSESPQVDVDLGPLKNVSRLHARIEYEESQEQFVLVVLGRNGAWVDGVWSGSGSRVPLNARSQIQIATRVFHFVLPPSPAPEDSPTPSSPTSSIRHLSPSIDITSLSPDSSLPSPPAPTKDLPPSAPTKHPNDVAAPAEKIQTKQPSTKKRKKPGSDPKPLPEVMPSRPGFTYAQLCYRAIKSMDGKATLQEICTWVSDNFDWYRYNEGSGWDSSIRHNLSSNKAFKKMERCAGERGKGFFWSVDPEHEHLFEDLEGKGSSAHSRDGTKHRSRGGKGSSTLEPPLKRSVKGEAKSPLPPPLTSTPLPAFTSSTPPNSRSQATIKPDPSAPVVTDVNTIKHVSVEVKQEPSPSDVLPTASSLNSLSLHLTTATQPFPSSYSQTTPAAPSPSLPELSEDVIVPIVIGPPSPISSTAATDASQPRSSIPDLSSRAIVLKDNTIILSPTIFSCLTPEQLKELEALGARKAIEILRSYIVRFLKEKIKTEGAKGKGKKRSKGNKSKGGVDKSAGGQSTDAPTGPSNSTDSSTLRPPAGSQRSQPKSKKVPVSLGPFTTAPLPQRKSAAPPDDSATVPKSAVAPPPAPPYVPHMAYMSLPPQHFLSGSSSTMTTIAAAVRHRQSSPPPMARLEEPMEQISITDDDEPAAKKPRLDTMETIEVV